MDFIKNNYLRTLGSGSDFCAEIDLPENKNIDFHTISKEVAEAVYETKEGKIYLFYSGGVDSEYILNLFLSMKMEVIPVIVKLCPNYNEHDIKYALSFCESKKLKPLIIDLDFDNFVRSGLIREIAEEFQIAAYQLPATFHCLDKVDGTIVMGSHGPAHMSLDSISGQWMVDEIEPIHTVLKYFKKKKLSGSPFFLAHTSEQYFSFINDPVMKSLANHRYPGKVGNNSLKRAVYNKLSNFNLVLREKYTGYENIEHSDIFSHPNLRCFEEFKNQWWGKYSVSYFDLMSRVS
jgi:hypothetical protein